VLPLKGRRHLSAHSIKEKADRPHKKLFTELKNITEIKEK
jgi:hypothetical protein